MFQRYFTLFLALFLSSCQLLQAAQFCTSPIFQTLYSHMQQESRQLSVQGAQLKRIINPLENPNLKGFTQSLALIDSYTQTNSVTANALYQEAHTVVLTALLMQQVHALKNQCYLILDNLLSYQHYWHLQALRPSWGNKLEQGPLKLISSKSYKDQLNNALQGAQADIEQYATYLGLLHDQIYKESLLSDQESLNNFIIETTFIIKACLDRTLYNGSTSINPPSIGDIRSVIVEHSSLIARYCATTLRTINYKRPSHIVRHWAFYTIALTSVLGAGIYWYRNPEHITKTIENLNIATKKFYDMHLYQPLKNSWDLLFKKNKDTAYIDTEQLVQEKTYKEIYLDLLIKKNNQKAISSQVSIQDLEKQIVQEITNRSSALIEDDFRKELKYPTLNIVNPHGTIVAMGFLKAQKVILMVTDMLKKVNDALNAQQLNIQILATIPAALAVSIPFSLAKKLYNPTRTAYLHIKNNLIETERLLNTHSVSPISHAAQGLIHYHLFSIKKYSSYIPAEFRLGFAQDLKELGDCQFTIQQRMNTIGRMHRAYAFLAH